MQGIIFNIKRFALHDGPGIRTTVFLKGCPQKCWWCHNPESISPEVSNGSGRLRTVAQVMREIEKEVIFYDESGGGVTFSGGEPMMQPEFLGMLLDECKEKAIHTALDTSGCVSPKIFRTLIDKADLFLYDLKLVDSTEHENYTRVSNGEILENLETLSQENKNVVIRFPLVPGITDTENNVTAVAEFVSRLKGIRDIDILPYHNSAGEKYRRLKIENKMAGVRPPTPGCLLEVKDKFQAYGLNVREVNE